MAINTFSGGNFINSIQAAGKNAIINGGFDIWQRGTTSASITTSQVYTADRWCCVGGASTAMTVSRQVTNDTTNLPNIQYCSRVQRTAGQTGTSYVQFAQSLETVNSIPFAGKTVTLSFYARAGANYSSASNALNVLLLTGTATDQQVLVGYTGSVSAINSSATLTTTWQRFTFTATLATNTNEIGVDFYYTPVGTAGTNDYFEVTGIQLELGSTATTFSRAGGTIQGELAACQRYYVRYVLSAAPAYWLNGVARGAATASCYFPMPVELRIVPTVMDYSGFRIYSFSAGLAYTGGTTTIEAYNNKIIQVNYVHGTNVFTTGTNILGGLDSTSSYIGFSAEL